jgi:6-pyruvoyl-tetrahydropterin synthase
VLNLSYDIINNQTRQQEFIEITSKLQEENLNRLQQELEWFISKFDYRFANEPWNTSKDALIRTIQKLIGNYNTKI